MSSPYSYFLTPKDRALPLPSPSYSSRPHAFPSSPKGLTLQQRINQERRTLYEKTHARKRTLTEGNETISGISRKPVAFVIKKKPRNNDISGNSPVLEGDRPVNLGKNPRNNAISEDNSLILEGNRPIALNGQCWEGGLEGFREEQLLWLVNNGLLRQKGVDWEALFVENGDYFLHLFGMCACFRCQCGKCRCKFALEGSSGCRLAAKGKNSTYSQDFVAKKVGKTERIEGFEEKGRAKPNMETLTMNQTEYRPYSLWTAGAGTLKKGLTIDKEAPFLGLSQYKSQFADWKGFERMAGNPPIETEGVGKLKFKGNTTYKDYFSPQNNRKINKTDTHVPKTQSPFFKGFPFLSETTNKASFPGISGLDSLPRTPRNGFKSVYSGASPDGLEKHNSPYSPTHFATTMTKDFRPIPRKACPVWSSDEDFKATVLQRMRELSTRVQSMREPSLRDH